LDFIDIIAEFHDLFFNYLINREYFRIMINFRKMWKELGVELELHDELLDSMEKMHENNFLWQKKRPVEMKRFDNSLHQSHSGRVSEILEHRKSGGKSIGTFCIYVPDEIAFAVNVIPIPLCGGSGWSIHFADKLLPRDICPLIRSTFGMAISGTCPYKKLKDFALGETTCDAKKKTWDLFKFKVLEVPQKKNKIDEELWLSEVQRFKKMMEKLSDSSIDPEKLSESIKLLNRKREMLRKINEYRKLPEPPISGLDALLISQIALNQDINAFISDAEILDKELEKRASDGISAYPGKGKRILIAGSPSPMGYSKVHYIAEASGLRVVADESCTGIRYFRGLVDETKNGVDDMVKAIAERYFSIDCSCFSPNTERVDNILDIIKEYKVDGVIHNILQYCHGFNIEARMIDKALEKNGIPSLIIETDYSKEDIGQIRTRIEAFAEMLEE
jgi:benzoyl-CoA reductase/2-hydroxyglutaryl-CoA dehydratase subunit BcrC/BadD/HgdB